MGLFNPPSYLNPEVLWNTFFSWLRWHRFPECCPAFLPAQPQSLAKSLSAFWLLPVVGPQDVDLLFSFCIHSLSGFTQSLGSKCHPYAHASQICISSLTFLVNSELPTQNILWMSNKQLNISTLPSSKPALASAFSSGKGPTMDQLLKLKPWHDSLIPLCLSYPISESPEDCPFKI